MNELKWKRVFIIEDNMMNMAVFGAALRQSGATVIQDIWGEGAEKYLLLSLPVDVILLDLMLRDHLSGYDIFDKIKQNPQLAGIPVIVVSAADASIELPKVQAKGFAGFIAKPIDARQLPSQIAACIQGQQIWYVPQENLEDFKK